MFGKMQDIIKDKYEDVKNQVQLKKQSKEELKETLKTFDTKITLNNFKQIYINKNTKEWYYRNSINKILSFNNVIDIEVIEDESSKTITKTKGTDKRKVALGKGLVGGALLGPVGAIIGGTQGKVKKNSTSVSKEKNYCTELSILITTNCPELSSITIKLIETKTNKNSIIYKNAKAQAQKTISLFKSFINNKDTQRVNITNLPSEQDKYDQLKKLKSLLDDGIINQQEFEIEKQKLLK